MIIDKLYSVSINYGSTIVFDEIEDYFDFIRAMNRGKILVTKYHNEKEWKDPYYTLENIQSEGKVKYNVDVSDQLDTQGF